MAYRAYSSDFGGHLPPLSSPNQQGWSRLMQTYMRTPASFECPSGYASAETNSTDYFANGRLSEEYMPYLDFPMQTITFGDGIDSNFSSAFLTELPLKWIKDESSPAQRHIFGANYAFLDGHVKFIQPAKISTKSPSDKKPVFTFAIRPE